MFFVSEGALAKQILSIQILNTLSIFYPEQKGFLFEQEYKLVLGDFIFGQCDRALFLFQYLGLFVGRVFQWLKM
jgi:hypothetical protein